MIGIALASLATLGAAAPTIAPSDVPADVLPSRWVMGDFATPVPYGDHTLYLFADPQTIDPVTGRNVIARSLMVVNGLEFIHPLDRVGDPNTFYWLTDATQLPDGSLLVAALEVCTPDLEFPQDHEFAQHCTAEYTNDGWGFVVVDTDLFIVNNPLEPGSWDASVAFGKLESGWWSDADGVEFSDQYPNLAFASNGYGDKRTTMYDVDLDNPESADQLARFPMRSDGVMAPVQTDIGWQAISYDYFANTATRWHIDNLVSGIWQEDETVQYDIMLDGQTHGWGLNIVDGQVVERHSVIGQRPVQEVIG